MGQKRKLTKDTPVAELDKILGIEPDVVREGDTLLAVAHKIVENPATRVVCVVDAANKLLGIIPLRHICQHVVYEIAPEEMFHRIARYEDVVAVAHHTVGATARDLMDGPVYTKTDDTVKDAIEKMFDAGLEGLPIVDEQLHVVGYIDMLELLAAWIQARGG